MNQKLRHGLFPLLALSASCSAVSPIMRDESNGSVKCGIDVHVHVGSPSIQSGNTQFDAERARLAAAAAGLSRVWLVASGYTAEAGRSDVVNENDYVLQAASNDPVSFVAAVAVPIGAPWATEELTRTRLRGASVVKLHPVAAGIDVASATGMRLPRFGGHFVYATRLCRATAAS